MALGRRFWLPLDWPFKGQDNAVAGAAGKRGVCQGRLGANAQQLPTLEEVALGGIKNQVQLMDGSRIAGRVLGSENLQLAPKRIHVVDSELNFALLCHEFLARWGTRLSRAASFRVV